MMAWAASILFSENHALVQGAALTGFKILDSLEFFASVFFLFSGIQRNVVLKVVKIEETWVKIQNCSSVIDNFQDKMDIRLSL